MKTCSEIRHGNLLDIIEQAGSVRAVADRLKVSHAEVSQLKTRAPHTKTGKPRNIGDETARKIEECFGLERGWMDHEHPSPAVGFPLALHAPVAAPTWPFSTPCARLHILNAGDIEAIDTMIKTLVAARERDAAAQRMPEKMAAGAY